MPWTPRAASRKNAWRRSTHIRGARGEQVVNAQNLSLRIFPSLCLAVPFLTADLALDNDDADPGVLD